MTSPAVTNDLHAVIVVYEDQIAMEMVHPSRGDLSAGEPIRQDDPGGSKAMMRILNLSELWEAETTEVIRA